MNSGEDRNSTTVSPEFVEPSESILFRRFAMSYRRSLALASMVGARSASPSMILNLDGRTGRELESKAGAASERARPERQNSVI